MSRKKRAKLWSVPRIRDPRYPGILLRVTEMKPGGPLFAVRMLDGKQRAASMKCTRKELGTTATEQEDAARAKALEFIKMLADAPAAQAKAVIIPQHDLIQPGDVLTLKMLANEYEKHGLHGRSEKYKKAQPRRLHGIVDAIGGDLDALSLSKSHLQRYTEIRRNEGARPRKGQEAGTKIRQGTIAAEILALKIALNWATEHRRAGGEPLLKFNPIARARIEHEKRPRRPVADGTRYTALRKVSDSVSPALSLALDLCWFTGRRIGAVIALRWADVMFDAEQAAAAASELESDFQWTAEDFPFGGVRWYADRRTDNKVHEAVIPINAAARAALERARPDIAAPDAWVFPAERATGRHIDYNTLRNLLVKAEERAKLPEQKGGGFHPFRRGWATTHKHHPASDVAKLGGWRDESTMRKCYQAADKNTIRKIVGA